MDNNKVLEAVNNFSDQLATLKSITIEGNDLLEKVDKIWEAVQGYPLAEGSSISPDAWGTYIVYDEPRTQLYKDIIWATAKIVEALNDNKPQSIYTCCFELNILIKQLGGAEQYSLTSKGVV